MTGLFSSASDHVDEIAPCPTALMLLREVLFLWLVSVPPPFVSWACPRFGASRLMLSAKSVMHHPVSLQASADADTL